MRPQHQRITKALELLARGLYPYVERELKAVYHEDWFDAARDSFREDRGQGDVIRWDAHSLLTVMWDQWNRVFRHQLTQPERSLVSELREFRNRWAHQAAFDFDDTYRLLDSVQRLLVAISADEAKMVAREKYELMRAKFSEDAQVAIRKAEDRRRKVQDLAIYSICCFCAIWVVMATFGIPGWILSVVIALAFAYFAYQRAITPPRIYHGAHECASCGKIIYSAECPYCRTAPPEGVAEFVIPDPFGNPPAKSANTDKQE